MAANRKRRRIWLWSALGLLLVSLLVLVAAFLPQIASTPVARRWLLSRANRALRPGGLEVASFRFSWFGPTILTGVALRDPEGRRVVEAPRVDWDRPLGRLLFDRPRYGTIRLVGATLDVVRGPDGEINIYEALRPILGPNPADDLTVVIDRGRLTVRGQGLDGPLVLEPLSLTLRRPPKPGALSWKLLAGEVDGRSLALDGTFDRWQPGPPRATIAVDARNYPALAVESQGVKVRGRPSGKVEATYEAGRWRSVGKLSMAGIEVEGAALRGDRAHLDRLIGAWSIAEGRPVEALDLDAGPLGNLHVQREGRLKGRVDLAALAALLPKTLHLREGLVIERGEAVVEALQEGARWTVSGQVDDLAATLDGRAISVRDPSTLTARIDGSRLDSLALKTPFLDLTARGDLDAGIVAEGGVDLDGLGRRLGDYVDLGGKMPTGKARLSATYRRQGDRYEGHAAVALERAGLGGRRAESPIYLDMNIEGTRTSWEGVTLGLQASGGASLLSARRVEGGAEVEWSAKGDLGGAMGEGTLSGRWSGRALRIVGLRLRAASGRDPSMELSIAATGRYDADAGRLTLRAADPAAALRLGPEGLVVEGVGGASARGTLGLAGDLSRLDEVAAAWSGREALGLVGDLAALATVRATDGGPEFAAKVRATRGDAMILGLDLSGAYRDQTGRITLAEAALSGPMGVVEASGEIADGIVDLKGQVSPAWDRINALLRDKVEPGASVAGDGGAFTLRGPLDGARIEAEGGVDLKSLDIYGMKLGATPLTVGWRGGKPSIGPIRASLNGGTVDVVPSLVDRGEGLLLEIAPGGSIVDAAINDEVSRRFLSLAAPVLDKATRVRGKVSATVDRASIPLRRGAGAKAVVEGKVVFQEVAFAPGPMALSVLSLVKREDASLTLNEPVQLSIADGRVTQRGLSVPVGGLTSVGLEGSVGFDRTIDLVASVPITPKMVGDNAFLGGVVGGARVSVPIGGTLDAPKVDADAFKLGLKDMGKGLLGRTAVQGLGEILSRMARPREEAAPAPPRMSAAERRALRQQRREQRKAGMPE